MNIVNENDGQLIVSINTDADTNLMQTDFDTLDNETKNDIIIVLARKGNMVLNEVTPEYILQYHRELKRVEMNQACDDAICDGFTATNGHIYRTNRDDQTNMIGQKDELNGDPTIEVVPWKTEDMGYIEHTREDWLSVYAQAFTFKKQNLFKYDSLKKDITLTTSHSDIIAIRWE